jgi:hypothetical protein
MSEEERERLYRLVTRYVETRKRGDALIREGAATIAAAFAKLDQAFADIAAEIAVEIAQTPDLAEWNVAMDAWYPQLSEPSKPI